MFDLIITAIELTTPPVAAAVGHEEKTGFRIY